MYVSSKPLPVLFVAVVFNFVDMLIFDRKYFNVLNFLAWDGMGISGTPVITLLFPVTDHMCDRRLFLKLEV